MSEQKKSKNKQETVEVIFAKNAETVDFGKYHLWYDKGVFKYNLNKNFSFSKQLSNNCGVFIINAVIDSETEDQYANKKFLLIVEPQYGAEFLNNKKLSEDDKEKLRKEDKENLSEDDYNKAIFTKEEKSLYRIKNTVKLHIAKGKRDDCIEKINSLINYYKVISGEKIPEIKTEEKNAENKDIRNKNTENKNVEISIPTFAFNIANIFEVVARVTISESLKNTDWEVLNGNDNEHEVLKSNKNNEGKGNEGKGNEEFYINGTVKPDIVIRKKVEENTYKYIIIDAKYKSPENKNRMDRLQILAYAYLYDAHIVGHIFPKKSKKTNKKLSFYDINTIFNKSLNKNPSDKYKYVELYLDDKNFENNLSDIINPGNENEKSNN